MTILVILKYILLFIIVILAAALIIPVEYSLKGEKYENAFIEANTSWFSKVMKFSFLKQSGEKPEFCLKLFGLTIKPNDIEKKKEKRKKKNKKKKKQGIFFSKELLEQAIKSVKELFKHSGPRIFEAEGVYGFDDPYYTGITCAVLNTLMPFSECFRVNLTPIFDEEILEGRFFTEGRIILGVVLWISIKFMLSSPAREAFRRRKHRKTVKTA